MKLPELLIPAGNLEKLRTALLYGADAVYAGVAGLSLRASAAEFDAADLATGVAEAHAGGAKVYAALNIFAKDRDLARLRRVLPELGAMGIDGVILSDPGVLQTVRQYLPEVPIHLSTQANTTNTAAVKFWREQGVRRIVLARELSLAEIGEIAAAVPEIEVEIFGHGAMCVAYSGRCFLSALRTGGSANAGECTQPCRWEYVLTESTRPDQPLRLEEDQRYSYILSSKDLCLIAHLPAIARAGIASLKVEGRMKSVYYVAAVTRTYRAALDALAADPDHYRRLPEWREELAKISNRGYTTGFYFRDANEKITELSPDVKYLQSYDLVGTVLAYEAGARRALIGVRNHLTREDQIELLLPDATLLLDPRQMTDAEGLPLTVAHNGYRIYLPVDREAPRGAVIRKKILGVRVP